HRAGGMAYIERRSLLDKQLNELKKYAVVAKISLTADEGSVLLGVAGFQARAALAILFSTLPDAESPVIPQGDSTLLWFDLPAE
ncbi:tRNA-modifying protein YgfZ, partial [Erwinia amylovora]|nr:tRNA-modifying protein YgfZ [Erwinia amylovora]